MLIISRKKSEKIMISDDIEITILELYGNRVRFSVKAPDHVSIESRLKGWVDPNIPVEKKVSAEAEKPPREIAAVAAYSRRRRA